MMGAVGLAQALPADQIRIATSPVTEPFWLAAREERLVAAQCGSCGAYRMPPTPFCPECASTSLQWPELSGAATVFSYSVVHGYPGQRDIILVPAVLDLPDAPGARLVSGIVDVAPADITIGMRVEVFFRPVADGWKIPLFRPARG
jgi:uncharacterized OB-fold protein